MKPYVISCKLSAAPESQRRGTWARVFVFAESAEDAIAKLKVQAKSEGYLYRDEDFEAMKLLESDTGLGVKEYLKNAAEQAAVIAPFDRASVGPLL